jgi:outer membrane cobalamin receptor
VSARLIRRTVAIGAGLLLTAVAPASAQTSPAPPDEPLRVAVDVVVTPDRGDTPRHLVPAATVVVEAAALPALPVVHATDVLTHIPGFHVVRPEPHAGRPVVSARGFFGGGEAEYVRLLVDGTPAGDVESGLVDWSRVPLASIQRVEAVRGPGAAMYGDAAVGGVIQIFTDAPASGGQATLSAGSFDTVIGDGGYQRRGDRVRVRLSGSARRTSGAFEHAGGSQYIGDGGISGATGAWTWAGTAAGDRRDLEDPGALPLARFTVAPLTSDPLNRFDESQRRTGSASFTLTRMSPAWHPAVRAYVSQRDEDAVRTIFLAPGLADRRARDIAALALGGSLDGEHAFGASRPLLIRFGTELGRDRLDVGYRGVDGSGAAIGARNATAGSRVRGAAFTAASVDLTQRVRVSGALRWDGISDRRFGPASSTQRAWSPRGGVVVPLGTGTTTLFAQAARAFKAPTLNQLFDPRPYPDFRGGTFTISNDRLVPQRADNVEVGASSSGTLRWTALAYRMRVRDEIDFDIRTFSYANISRSVHAGVEVDGEVRWWTHVRPALSYALARVTAEEGDRQLKNVPRHHFSASLSADLVWSVGLYARLTRTAGAFLDDANELPVPSASTLDVRARRPIGRTVLFVDVLNAANRHYADYGFTLTDFAGRPAPYVYAAAPRAIRIGATTSF